ncbi:MAG: IPT/TIG domain-containing protein, partial [Bryobacteraceae bacterium]
SPGEIVSIFGKSLGPAAGATLTLDSTGKVSTSLGGVTVSFNGYPAPLTYVGAGQINAIVPYEVAGSSTATVQVSYDGSTSNQPSLPIAASAPALFTTNYGTGPGAILNQDYSVNTQANPAAVGSVVQVYMTGEGLTTPAEATGEVTVATAAPPYTPTPQLPVSVTIGGQPAQLQWDGEAPDFVAGVLQVNVTIPATATSGANSIAVKIGANSSQSGVTVWVK